MLKAKLLKATDQAGLRRWRLQRKVQRRQITRVHSLTCKCDHRHILADGAIFRSRIAPSDRDGKAKDIHPFHHALAIKRRERGRLQIFWKVHVHFPLAIAIDRGWLQRDAERVVPTVLGRRFTNDVVSLFLEEMA